MVLLHEKLVDKEQWKTLSSTFSYNLQDNKAYFNTVVRNAGGILIKKRTHKDILMLKDVIKSARIDCGYTQEEIAKRVKVAKQTYLKWENGETEPKATQIKLLAEHLKITPNEICSGALNKKMDLEEFIIQMALSRVPNEVVTMYTWKTIPDHQAFFEDMKNLSRDDYDASVVTVSETEKLLR
ncbi:helix-turn-helix transcriptional regulator [Vibrio sp. F12]|nr:helix-turn-helix transcriptional regulator [Vibrio sp. F12]